MAGIYIHIPFCRQFCTYCNFYSVKGRGYKEKFLNALHKEIDYRKQFFKYTGVRPQTIYFGGGTPSLFSGRQLGDIINHLVEVFQFFPVEITLEVNPNDIYPQYADDLLEAGFNRVSMGVQSFIDSHLQFMNRRHIGDEGVEAYRTLRKAGFGNISLDLIFGYDGLSNDDWEYNLSVMTSLAPEHISAYQMSIDPGSALYRMLERGEYNVVPDDICHNQYTFLQNHLKQHGYCQYEVSNFAKAVEGGSPVISLHNSSYWTKEPYLGLGPAAHSYTGKQRLWNNPGLARYCAAFLEGAPLEGVCGSEELTAVDMYNESLMLGLRTVDGVNVAYLNRGFYKESLPQIERHIRLGNLVREGDMLRIPSNRLFVSDGIISDLFV